MKVRILGCGGSFGSPLAWNKNGNIDVNNPKNHRTRSSVLIDINDQNLLIDTSPDLRAQLYNAKCTKLITPSHDCYPSIDTFSTTREKIIIDLES